MKKIFSFLALAAIVLSSQNANAKIRRVGYFGPPILNTDYADLQSAHDAANAGDTLLLFPGSWIANYSKKLITIGYGYYNDTLANGTGANIGLQNIKGNLSCSVYLYAGASNSVFEGIGDGASIIAYYLETVSNITIRRCNGSFSFNNAVCNNWLITQSFIQNLGFNWTGGTPTNLIVSNCYIAGLSLAVGSGVTQTGQFTNNTIASYSNSEFGSGSFILKNNIILGYHSLDANCVYQNNLFNTDYGTLPAGTGNIGANGAVMASNVFVGYSTQGTYSYDGRYALKPGSPAIGAGAGGTDCGMFGGTNPYKLSGMPRIPAFYKLTAPSNITSTNPYTITFSVRSNN